LFAGGLVELFLSQEFFGDEDLTERVRLF
jgi:hypothetical protein